MSDGVIISIIGASVPFLGMIGAGLAWLLKFVQAQSKTTIDAKDAEINALKIRIELLEQRKEVRA